MKKIIVITIIAFCAFTRVNSEPEVGDTASSRFAWNFEIYNKSSRPIWVSVGYIQGLKGLADPRNSSVIDQQFLAGAKGGTLKGQKVRAVVDFKAMPIITIWNQEPKFFGGPNPVFRRGISACQELQKGEICTQQAFLTWDDNGLRPQTGQFLGLPQMFGQPGITDSGMKITNNVNQLQIQKVR